MKKIQTQKNGWVFKREVNLNMLIQIIMLAGLIISSWVNIQKQLFILQHDVNLILEKQNDYQAKLDCFNERTLAMEYRIKGVEKQVKSQ